MKAVSWQRVKATLRKPDPTPVISPEDAAAEAAAAAKKKEEEDKAANNRMTMMITQALELAEVEADGKPDALLGDMEVTYRATRKAVKPPPLPVVHEDGSNTTWRTPTKNEGKVDAASNATVGGVEEQPKQIITTEEDDYNDKISNMSTNSPTSVFEYDILSANHPSLDFDTLQKSYSRALMDEEEESILSEESIHDADSFISDTSARCNAGETDMTTFIYDVLSPIDCMSDYAYCQLKCNFPNVVEEVNDVLSSNLHHLVFDEEVVAEQQPKEGEGTVANNDDSGGGGVNQGEGSGGNVGKEGTTENVASGEQVVVKGKGQDLEEADNEEEEEEQSGEEIVVEVDGEKNSEEAQVEVVMGRWLKMHTEYESASYTPSEGFALRRDGKLPTRLGDDQVMIRVDASTIAARDCFERNRRNKNEELKDDVFVPGHEIIGHVVRTGADVEAESFLDKRVAAILPNGGGWSQYVCINARDAISVPEGADNEDVVTLLSTYMTAYQCLQSVVDADDAKAKEDEDAESVVAKLKGDDDTHSVATTATDMESVSTKATDVETDSESKAGVETAEPKDSPTIPDDTVEKKEEEEKKSPLFGKNVLIIDCGSPIGKALIELAQNAGATVQTTTHFISTFFAMRWKGAMDLVVDTVGDVDNNPALYKIMKTRGKLVRVNITSCGEKYIRDSIAGKTPAGKDVSYYGRVVKDKAIEYDVFQSFDDDREVFAEDLAYLHHLLQLGKIKPKISPQVGFEELKTEWDNLMTGRNDFAVVSPWKLGFTKMNG